jgi:anti-sigma factor RsiW
MNEVERDELLAGYLGGELTAEDRARFESMMADDPALAADVAGLRRTIQAMRSLDAPGSGRAPGSADGAAPTSVMRPLRMWWGAVVRYAAVIGLAFAAGYFMRGGAGPEAQTGIPAARPDERADSDIALPVRPEAGEWLQRAAEVYVNHPGGSSFARSLVAIAEAGEDDQ